MPTSLLFDAGIDLDAFESDARRLESQALSLGADVESELKRRLGGALAGSLGVKQFEQDADKIRRILRSLGPEGEKAFEQAFGRGQANNLKRQFFDPVQREMRQTENDARRLARELAKSTDLSANSLRSLRTRVQGQLGPNALRSFDQTLNTRKVRDSFDDILGRSEKFSSNFQGIMAGAFRIGPLIAAGLGIGGLTVLARQFGQLTKAAIIFAADFEIALARVRTIAEQNFNIEGTTRELERIATSVPQSLTTLTDGLFRIISSGVKETASALQVLETSAKVAVAGVSDAETASKAIVVALNAFGKSSEDAEKVANIFFKTIEDGIILFPEIAATIGDVANPGALAGATLGEVAAAMATITKQGIGAEEAATALRQTFLKIVAATPAAKQAFKELTNGELELSQAGIEAAGGFTNFIARVREVSRGSVELLRAIFPNERAFRGVSIIAGTAADEFQRLSREFNDVAQTAGVSDRAFTLLNETATNQTKLLKDSLSVAVRETAQSIIDFLLPAVRDLTDFLNDTTPIEKTVRQLINLGATARETQFLGLVSDISKTRNNIDNLKKDLQEFTADLKDLDAQDVAKGTILGFLFGGVPGAVAGKLQTSALTDLEKVAEFLATKFEAIGADAEAGVDAATEEIERLTEELNRSLSTQIGLRDQIEAAGREATEEEAKQLKFLETEAKTLQQLLGYATKYLAIYKRLSDEQAIQVEQAERRKAVEDLQSRFGEDRLKTAEGEAAANAELDSILKEQIKIFEKKNLFAKEFLDTGKISLKDEKERQKQLDRENRFLEEKEVALKEIAFVTGQELKANEDITKQLAEQKRRFTTRAAETVNIPQLRSEQAKLREEEEQREKDREQAEKDLQATLKRTSELIAKLNRETRQIELGTGLVADIERISLKFIELRKTVFETPALITAVANRQSAEIEKVLDALIRKTEDQLRQLEVAGPQLSLFNTDKALSETLAGLNKIQSSLLAAEDERAKAQIQQAKDNQAEIERIEQDSARRRVEINQKIDQARTTALSLQSRKTAEIVEKEYKGTQAVISQIQDLRESAFQREIRHIQERTKLELDSVRTIDAEKSARESALAQKGLQELQNRLKKEAAFLTAEGRKKALEITREIQIVIDSDLNSEELKKAFEKLSKQANDLAQSTNEDAESLENLKQQVSSLNSQIEDTLDSVFQSFNQLGVEIVSGFEDITFNVVSLLGQIRSKASLLDISSSIFGIAGGLASLFDDSERRAKEEARRLEAQREAEKRAAEQTKALTEALRTLEQTLADGTANSAALAQTFKTNFDTVTEFIRSTNEAVRFTSDFSLDPRSGIFSLLALIRESIGEDAELPTSVEAFVELLKTIGGDSLQDMNAANEVLQRFVVSTDEERLALLGAIRELDAFSKGLDNFGLQIKSVDDLFGAVDLQFDLFGIENTKDQLRILSDELQKNFGFRAPQTFGDMQQFVQDGFDALRAGGQELVDFLTAIDLEEATEEEFIEILRRFSEFSEDLGGVSDDIGDRLSGILQRLDQEFRFFDIESVDRQIQRFAEEIKSAFGADIPTTFDQMIEFVRSGFLQMVAGGQSFQDFLASLDLEELTEEQFSDLLERIKSFADDLKEQAQDQVDDVNVAFSATKSITFAQGNTIANELRTIRTVNTQILAEARALVNGGVITTPSPNISSGANRQLEPMPNPLADIAVLNELTVSTKNSEFHLAEAKTILAEMRDMQRESLNAPSNATNGQYFILKDGELKEIAPSQIDLVDRAIIEKSTRITKAAGL